MQWNINKKLIISWMWITEFQQKLINEKTESYNKDGALPQTWSNNCSTCFFYYLLRIWSNFISWGFHFNFFFVKMFEILYKKTKKKNERNFIFHSKKQGRKEWERKFPLIVVVLSFAFWKKSVKMGVKTKLREVDEHKQNRGNVMRALPSVVPS